MTGIWCSGSWEISIFSKFVTVKSSRESSKWSHKMKFFNWYNFNWNSMKYGDCQVSLCWTAFLVFLTVYEGLLRKSPNAFTAKNTVISPDFLVWKFCGKAQFPHMRKLCLSAKYPHHEISWNYDVFCSDSRYYKKYIRKSLHFTQCLLFENGVISEMYGSDILLWK